MPILLSRRSVLTALMANIPNICRAAKLFPSALAASGRPISPQAGNDQAQSGASASDAHRTYWFTDVAPKSTFAYRSNNDFAGRKYFPQPMCGGIGVVDYDNDGRMDLFFTNGAKLPELKKTGSEYFNCLLRNRGDGTFEDVTAKAGLDGADLDFSFGVAVADYDNDGWDDIFICNAGENALYHNNRNGTFTNVTAGSGLDRKPENVLSVGAAWLDYNNDGLLDLIVTNYTTWTPQTDKRCQMGPDQDEYCSPTIYKSVASRLYRNLGDGKFKDVTNESGIGSALGKGMGISVADFNGDGLMDIFVANDTEPNFLFINQGDGTFKESGLEYGVAYNVQGTSVSGMGCDARDFNNDGWVDIVYNDLYEQVFGLLRNDGGKSFTDVTWPSRFGALTRNLSGWSIGFIDYNNDGWKDVYSANGDVDNLMATAKQHDTMFQNIDGSRLADVTESMGPDFNFVGYQRGSAFVDLNNDGFLDLVVTSLNEKPRILMNNALQPNHWILLDLRGHKSNRSAIGATIIATTASGRKLYNHVNPSVGFMSSSDRRVHFGLGPESGLDHVEIRWPSGIVQRIDRPKVDQILKVDEPDAATMPEK
jgi:enediyne biosynthesis protein E4